MSQAIIKGSIEKNCITGDKAYVYDIDESKSQILNREFGVKICTSVVQLCENCDIIVLAVKPNVLSNVLPQIKDAAQGKTLVSIAAGWDADKIKSVVGADQQVIRLMPNTPLMVGEGMSVFESPSNADGEILHFVEGIFSALGKVAQAPSKLMHAVTAMSGSGPAYVFMFIEALTQAGVACGLQEELSATLAAQTVLGAAKMVQETGSHPRDLKEAVCSPGGTTIEGVKSLEEDGFNTAVISAVQKATEKSKKLAQ